MSRQDSLQGSLPLLVLKILARQGALHGYGLTTQIEAMSEDVLRVEEGSLYPALHRMEEAGWIEAKWITTPNKRKARLYEITGAGRGNNWRRKRPGGGRSPLPSVTFCSTPKPA